MPLLNDTEKITFLTRLLDHHLEKLPTNDSLANYLESIRGFLSTDDSILQKAAISNSELFIDTLSRNLSSKITYKQATGTLIAAFNNIGLVDSMDAAAVILEFEKLLDQMTLEEAENLYKESWDVDHVLDDTNEGQSIGYIIQYLESYLDQLNEGLQTGYEDLFLQGKINGLQHALKYLRMHERGRNSHYINIVIDDF